MDIQVVMAILVITNVLCQSHGPLLFRGSTVLSLIPIPKQPTTRAAAELHVHQESIYSKGPKSVTWRER